jgi:plasmid maintenance system killer protein
MIRSFQDRITEAVFQGRCPKGFPADLFKTVRRKLTVLNSATMLDDLKVPASNRLHPLGRDNTPSRSTTNSGSVSFGRMPGRNGSSSRTTTRILRRTPRRATANV